MTAANILDFRPIPFEDLAAAVNGYQLGEMQFKNEYYIFKNNGKRFMRVTTTSGVRFYFPGSAVNVNGKDSINTGTHSAAAVKYHERLGLTILERDGSMLVVDNSAPARILGDDPRLSTVTMYLSSRIDDTYESQIQRVGVTRFEKAGGSVVLLSNEKDLYYNTELVGSIVSELNVLGNTMFVIDHVKGLVNAPRPILCYNRIYYSNEEGLSRLL